MFLKEENEEMIYLCRDCQVKKNTFYQTSLLSAQNLRNLKDRTINDVYIAIL